MEGVLVLKSTSPPSCSPPQISTPLLSVDSQEDQHVHPSSPAPPNMCDASVPPPPPPPPCLPPPPPPPPPPPLPPPLLPPPPFSSRGFERRSMKKLNWDAIPSQRVLGRQNVWTSKRIRRDLVLDIRSMEELFSHVDKRASLRRSRIVGRNNCDGLDLSPPEPQVTILDSKKSMNIGIFLRHFKRPVEEMVQDICQGSWLRFGNGKLKELCKLLPEESEVKQLMSFSGNLSVLPEADRFMVQLVKVPGYEERLKTMQLREEFFPLMEEVKNAVAVLIKGANELLDCDDLHSVIRLVLKAGNYMNAGGYSANAIGFRMTSLLKLADTKANKPGMNLMHYVAKQAEEIDAELLTFPTQLQNIRMASRVCKDEVIADFEREVKKLKEVKLYSSRHPNLLQQIETFLMRAEAKLAEVDSALMKLNVLNTAVAEYFCEDPATFKLDECCSIFHSFCMRFDKAVQENREREAAEERHKRKDKRRFTVSRRAAPGCDRDSSLESALHSFLSTAPEEITRCRKSVPAPIKGTPAESKSERVPLIETTEATPPARQETPEKKHQTEDKQLESKGEAENMREVTKKVLHYQNSHSSLHKETEPRTSPQSDRVQHSPETPNTFQPRSRDFFFANNGKVGSPWTILSPFTCSDGNQLQQNRRAHRRRLSSMPSGDELDDGVWVTDSNGDALSSPCRGSASLPEGPIQRAVSQGPLLRSISVDETWRSPASLLRLGELFQRNASQRSYSSGSRTGNMGKDGEGVCSLRGTNQVDGQGSNSGFISFFRRIGGRSKPGDADEQNLEGANT